MTRVKTKDNSEGQDILAMKYDPYNFRIVTLTEEYVIILVILGGILEYIEWSRDTEIQKRFWNSGYRYFQSPGLSA